MDALKKPVSASNEDLAEYIREAVENDPKRLKSVASLLLAVPRKPATTALQKRLEQANTQGWERFRAKLQGVTSYTAAQELAETIPRTAAPSERGFHAHLGRYIQTRIVPDDATSDERIELEAMLLRIR